MTSVAVDLRRPVVPTLGALIRPWRAALAGVVATVAVAALLDLAPPLVMRSVIDEHLVSGDAAGLLPLALLYFGATAGVHALTFVYGYLATVVAQAALSDLRVRLVAHIHRLPMPFFDRRCMGDVISRCTADVETIDELFSSGVATLVAELVRLAAIGVTMVVLSPALSLVAACGVPILVLTTRFFQVRVRSAQREQRRTVGLLNTRLQEDLAGVEVIHAFAREEAFVGRFRRALKENLTAIAATARYNALFLPLMSMVAALTSSLLLWAGAHDLFASLGVSIGTLAAFVLLFQRFFKPIINVADEWQTVQSALAGWERISELLAEPVDEVAPGPSIVRPSAFPLAVTDLTFGYRAGHPVIRGISFDVSRGEQVALVGRTGAGKSSVISLLAGLYLPWSGTLRINGLDPRSVPEEMRRRTFGVVPQAVQLFSATALDNIRLSDDGVPADAVVEAARIAGIDALIQALPDGYDTMLSGSGRAAGAQLSAGQRQLLALARAVVWDPVALLLDEATAAVDGATEAAITDALRRIVLAKGCAIVSVAHRLATARAADRVLVLEAGRIVEEGAPTELMRSGGRFAALVELEAAGWQTET